MAGDVLWTGSVRPLADTDLVTSPAVAPHPTDSAYLSIAIREMLIASTMSFEQVCKDYLDFGWRTDATAWDALVAKFRAAGADPSGLVVLADVLETAGLTGIIAAEKVWSRHCNSARHQHIDDVLGWTVVAAQDDQAAERMTRWAPVRHGWLYAAAGLSPAEAFAKRAPQRQSLFAMAALRGITLPPLPRTQGRRTDPGVDGRGRRRGRRD